MNSASNPRPRILIINGSLGGSSGNTNSVLAKWGQALSSRADVRVVHLAETFPSLDELRKMITEHEGFVFATGTYWDSWGSPLQRFFEEVTPLEGNEAWLGKPAAALVTMHSVGGKGVLSRLQGVLSTLGLLIPPMSGMAYSLASQLALASESEFSEDFWQLGDLEVMSANLIQASKFNHEAGSGAWRAWSVDRADPRRRWT